MSEESFQTHDLVLASRASRFCGSLIDAAVVGIPTAIVAMAVFILIWPIKIHPDHITFGDQMAVEAACFIGYFLLFLLVNGYTLLSRGQTIGKVILKIRIVDLDGNIPGFGKIVVFRYLIPSIAFPIPLLGSVFALVDSLFIFGAEHRCVHDYIAGTKVINANATLHRVLPPPPNFG
jgi:uncharacterized RDD family membrane protein YckC